MPIEGLWCHPAAESFFFRVENLILDGGFAMVSGETGLGKSKIMTLLDDRLRRIEDVQVRVIERPQSSLGDFYREIGELFEVNLSPANRYGGFKALRERWHNHIKKSLMRPVLLVDEAQEMATPCLNELRLLSSAQFDSECILTTVLSGDSRLPERFRSPALLPLGSRTRVRLNLEPLTREHLLDFLDHALTQAGAPQLMTDELKEVLAAHCAGNLRLLCGTATELLLVAAERKMSVMDERLYLDVFGRQPKAGRQQKDRGPAPIRTPRRAQ